LQRKPYTGGIIIGHCILTAFWPISWRVLAACVLLRLLTLSTGRYD